MLRDKALFVSGLLVEKRRPSVKPTSLEVFGKNCPAVRITRPATAKRSMKKSLHLLETLGRSALAGGIRRGGPGVLVVRKMRTNTPLQALTLLNDVTFVEAARKLAERAMKKETRPEKRMEFAFRAVTALPSNEEQTILLEGFQHHLAEYRRIRMLLRKLLSIRRIPT